MTNHSFLKIWVSLLAISLFGASSCIYVAAGAETVTIKVNATPFQVEIAQTAAERQRGLMYRTHLPDNHGMLFIQPEPAPAAFWMKSTYIPLDLLYFDASGQLIELYPNVPPCSTPQCPIYTSSKAVKYILEINGGSANRLGLKLGDQLQFD